MIALTAYGVKKANKAYKKHKAEKEAQKGAVPPITDPSGELRTSQDGAEQSPLAPGGMVNYASSVSTTTSRDRESRDISEYLSPSRSSKYTDSVYSNTSTSSPVVDFRQYQQYVERQSHGYMKGLDEPPSYDTAMSQQPSIHDSRMQPPHPNAASMILGTSPWLTHQQVQPYSANQDQAQPMYPQQILYQQQVPMSAASEMPDTGTYQSTRSYATGSSLEPPSAISELPADVPMPLSSRNTPEPQELPASSALLTELPTTHEEGEALADRQKRASSLKRLRSDTGSESSDEEKDKASLHEGDLAKRLDLA